MILALYGHSFRGRSREVEMGVMMAGVSMSLLALEFALEFGQINRY